MVMVLMSDSLGYIFLVLQELSYLHLTS
jgi:hypothetical protein